MIKGVITDIEEKYEKSKTFQSIEVFTKDPCPNKRTYVKTVGR